jgi:purine-binding chemotaxis protein CheW
MESMETTVQGFPSAVVHEGKYLTFSVAAEEYGISIRKVKEIIGMMAVTGVPQAASYMKGVINLRGKVIPVVDLRLKFGFEEGAHSGKTCIIVVEAARDDARLHIGIIVDSVSEVLNIKGDDVEPTPDFGVSMDARYILGMAKSGVGVKILLDIDRVLCSVNFMDENLSAN